MHPVLGEDYREQASLELRTLTEPDEYVLTARLQLF